MVLGWQSDHRAGCFGQAIKLDKGASKDQQRLAQQGAGDGARAVEDEAEPGIISRSCARMTEQDGYRSRGEEQSCDPVTFDMVENCFGRKIAHDDRASAV